MADENRVLLQLLGTTERGCSVQVLLFRLASKYRYQRQ